MNRINKKAKKESKKLLAKELNLSKWHFRGRRNLLALKMAKDAGLNALRIKRSATVKDINNFLELRKKLKEIRIESNYENQNIYRDIHDKLRAADKEREIQKKLNKLKVKIFVGAKKLPKNEGESKVDYYKILKDMRGRLAEITKENFPVGYPGSRQDRIRKYREKMQKMKDFDLTQGTGRHKEIMNVAADMSAAAVDYKEVDKQRDLEKRFRDRITLLQEKHVYSRRGFRPNDVSIEEWGALKNADERERYNVQPRPRKNMTMNSAGTEKPKEPGAFHKILMPHRYK